MVGGSTKLTSTSSVTAPVSGLMQDLFKVENVKRTINRFIATLIGRLKELVKYTRKTNQVLN